jgi:hypothetical protein
VASDGAVPRRLAIRPEARAAPLSALTPSHRRAIRDGFVVAGLVFLAWRFFIVGPEDGHVGADAFAYWILDPGHPYALPNSAIGAFLYPPPMVRAFAPAALLSWPAFWWLWTSALVATAVWLGWRRTLLVLAFPPVALELYFGNVNLLVAAAIALGFRYPATWAFVLLTKVTPGVGLLWFAVRREWRALAIALGVTAVIVAISLAIDGPLWGQWLTRMTQDATDSLGGVLAIPLWLRLPMAALLVIWGARTDRRWTVPVAATLALPVLWIAGFSILAALAAIDRPELAPRATAGARPPSAAPSPRLAPR